MNYLFDRLKPLIRGARSDSDVRDQLTEEMAYQAEAIRTAGYDVRGLSKQDIACVEAFPDVYNQMCAAIIAVENGKKSALKPATEDFEHRFDAYAMNLQENLGDVKYNMLIKEVYTKIKKLSVKEPSFPAVSRLSPSYLSVPLAD